MLIFCLFYDRYQAICKHALHFDDDLIMVIVGGEEIPSNLSYDMSRSPWELTLFRWGDNKI